MPYARKRYAKKPYRAKRSSLARAVKKVIAKAMPKPEKKFFTQTASDGSIDTAGTITQLSAIAQGDDVNNRQGNDVQMDYLDINLIATNTNATGDEGFNTILRFLIVQDTQQNNITPTIAQVLSSVDVLSHLNPDNVGRFKVIFDKKVVLNSEAQDQVAKSLIQRSYLHCYHKFSGKSAKLEFTGAAGTDVHNNHLYFMAIPSTDEIGSFSFDSRIGYYDN